MHARTPTTHKTHFISYIQNMPLAKRNFRIRSFSNRQWWLEEQRNRGCCFIVSRNHFHILSLILILITIPILMIFFFATVVITHVTIGITYHEECITLFHTFFHFYMMFFHHMFDFLLMLYNNFI